MSAPLRYCVDLQGLHTLCDRNYLRLTRLLPELEVRDHFHFRWSQSGGDADLQVIVRERSRFTDVLELVLDTLELPWYPRLELQVRLYHDARMAEVIEFQHHRHIPARNRFPNDRCYQQDEKSQVNAFLADCLRHCLEEGYALFDIRPFVPAL